jgi:hypothetical protein
MRGKRSKKKQPPPPKNWPRTVDEAVEVILTKWLSPRGKAEFQAMKREELGDCHFGLGLSIRNEMGLWGGNEELKRDTGEYHPDDASGVIVEAAWERLQKEAEPHPEGEEPAAPQ